MENMAPPRRRPKTSLEKELPPKSSLKEFIYKEAHQFEFHALVKVLERLNPLAPGLGEGTEPDKEALRIKTRIGFDFPTTDIDSLEHSESNQVEVTTSFFNVAGIQGPLPTPYIQRIIDRDRHKDTALHSFLDIFNHRLISLLHRIRKKYWVGVAADPPETTFMGRTLKCLLGLGMIKNDSRLKILDRSLLFYAGLVWQRPRSTMALEKLLSHYFNAPIQIEEFQGGWVTVPEVQQTKIGKTGRFHVLGKDVVLGDRFWDQQEAIKIHVGPIGIKDYINFLKPGKAYRALKILVAYYCGEHQNYHLNLILKKEEVPTVKLGEGMALHWTSWINRKITKWSDDEGQNTMTKKSFKIP